MSVVLAAALTFLPSTDVPQCAPGLIHSPPLCLTAEQFEAMWNPPTPPPISLEGQVRVIAYYFWPDWAAERMIRIAKCESNFEPWAVNSRSGAAGIWQVMPFWKKLWPGNHLDAWTNGAVAYQIWLSQGFGAWVCK